MLEDLLDSLQDGEGRDLIRYLFLVEQANLPTE